MFESSTIITALINTGGMGIIAGVLLYLHVTTLKQAKENLDKIIDRFTKELEMERRQCHDDHERILSSIAMVQQSITSACRSPFWPVIKDIPTKS